MFHLFYVSFDVRRSLFLSVAVLFLATTHLFAQNQIDPELLSQFKMVEEKGKKIVQADLSSILKAALERSSTIEILGYDNQIAKENWIAAKEGNYPVLTNSYNVNRSVSSSRFGLTGDSASTYMNLTATDFTTLSTSWTQKTDLGISYGLTYQRNNSLTSLGSFTDKDANFSGWQSLDNTLYGESLTANLNIPLFKDFGDANLLSENRAEVVYKQTRLQSQKSELQLLNQIATIYWDLVGVHQTIETLEAALTLAERFYEDNQTRFRLGVLDPVEVKQSETQVARAKQALLQEVARKQLIEDQLRAVLNLKSFPYEYMPTDKPSLKDYRFEFEQLLKEVYETDRDLKILKENRELTRLNAEDALNQDSIDLDLNLLYRVNGFGKEASEPSSKFSESGLRDYQVGLVWTVPLFDYSTPGKIRKAELERTRADLMIESLKTQLTVELQSNLRNLELATESIRLAETSVSLERDLLEKETEKFKLGDSTSFRVAQVQQDLSEAQRMEILTRIQYEKVFLALLIKTNRIYKFYNLDPK